MLGYVIPDKGELKVREYEIYTGYYCGICKYIGSTYGQLPRMVLSYDAAFIALLLACVDEEPDAPSAEHCVVHHIRRKTTIRNRAIEFSGDLMLILAWYKLLDDVNDEGRLSAKAGLAAFRPIWRKLQKKHPSLCSIIGERLEALAVLEKEHCPSIDRVSEDFAQVMSLILQEGITFLYGPEEQSSTLHEIYANIGYHLGKWIYLIDAVDDIEENLETGSYNPLLHRFGYRQDETAEEFRARIDDQLRFNLFTYLAVISESFESLDIQKNSGIIENVIFFGLNRRTEEVLKRIKPERSGHGRL